MGVDALASYRYMPDTGETSENILKQAAQEARADGLLLMRPVRVEEKTMLSELGQDYPSYMKRTKRLIPYLI